MEHGDKNIQKEALQPEDVLSLATPQDHMGLPFYPACVSLFSQDCFDLNTRYINVFRNNLTNNCAETGNWDDLHLFDAYLGAFTAFDPMELHHLRSILKSNTIQDELQTSGIRTRFYPKGCSRLLCEAFGWRDRPFTTTAPFHETQYDELKALEMQGVDLTRTCLVIADTHLDALVPHRGADLLEEIKQGNILHGGSFLIPLLEQGLGGVVVFGLSHFDITPIQHSSANFEGRTFDEAKQYVRDGRLVLVDPYRFTQGNPERQERVELNTDKFSKGVVAAVYNLARAKGLQNIVFSIDVDALHRSEIGTAVNYSQWAAILAAGIVPFEAIVGQILDDRISIPDGIKLMTQYLLDVPIEARRHSELQRLYDPSTPIITRAITGQTEIGMQELEQVVGRTHRLCKETGLNFGIPLEQGGVYRGGVYECNGYDLAGKTFQQVVHLIKLLNRPERIRVKG